MNSKEALGKLFMAVDEELLYEQSGYIFATELTKPIEQDLDRLEQLEKENQELKKRYKKRAELSNELCEALKKYEKVFEILIDNLGVEIKHRVYDKSDGGVADDWFIDCAVYDESLTEEEYKLLKQVFESVGDSDD